MDATFLQERITKTKEQIVALEDAMTGLIAGSIQSYTLDTGQSRQTVTKANVQELEKVLDSLYNRCAVLETRLNGNGSFTGRPAF